MEVVTSWVFGCFRSGLIAEADDPVDVTYAPNSPSS